MKSRRNLLLGVASLLVLAAGYTLRGIRQSQVNLVPEAQAQEQDSRRCSLKTLKGAYGIKFEGQKIGVGPFVSVSRITFDGNGVFTTSEIGRFNGALVQ